jgi:hypothetical protein
MYRVVICVYLVSIVLGSATALAVALAGAWFAPTSVHMEIREINGQLYGEAALAFEGVVVALSPGLLDKHAIIAGARERLEWSHVRSGRAGEFKGIERGFGWPFVFIVGRRDYRSGPMGFIDLSGERTYTYEATARPVSAPWDLAATAGPSFFSFSPTAERRRIIPYHLQIGRFAIISVAYGTLVFAIVCLAKSIARYVRIARMLCPRCAYPIQDVVQVCPECGRPRSSSHAFIQAVALNDDRRVERCNGVQPTQPLPDVPEGGPRS